MRITLTSIIIFLSIALVSAQKFNKPFENDTIQGDTTQYESGFKVDKYDVVVGFQFTKTDVADSLSKASLQGSYDAISYVDVGGTGELAETTTDGTTIIYANPSIYTYYRAFLSCAVGDTVAVTNARLILKE